MKIASTVITSAAALLLITAPAFAQGAGGTGSGSTGTGGTGTVGTPGTSPGTPGLPGTGTPGSLGGGTATTPCVGVNCPSGGMGSPNTPGGTTPSTPGTSVPDPSQRGNPVKPSTGVPMSERDCLGGGWSRAGLPNAAACFSAPGISR